MTILQQVVLILPYQDNKVLMQLRDQKTDIPFPGHWGFLGGSIEPGEMPLQSARRELREEIGQETDDWSVLSIDRARTTEDLLIYSFYFPLNVRLDDIRLSEGWDIGLFTLDEICSRQLFSIKTGSKHPVVEHPVIKYLVRKLSLRLETQIKTFRIPGDPR